MNSLTALMNSGSFCRSRICLQMLHSFCSFFFITPLKERLIYKVLVLKNDV